MLAHRGNRQYSRPSVTLRSLLVVYGVVVALLGGVVLWVAAPDPWPLQSFRVKELNAALDAREAGEPPLVGFRTAPNGQTERYAPGVGDDQGIYLFAPIASQLVGLSATDGVKLLWVVLFAGVIGAAPLLYRRLFSSTAAALVAPPALLLAVLALQRDNIYWISAWAVLALLPPLILLDRERPRQWLAILLLLVIGASFASSIRSQAGLPIALAALIVVVTARMDWWRRGLGVVAVALAYLSVSTVGLAAVREYRDDHVAGDLGRGQLTAHPFWHNVYLGLGYLPNDEGIRYRDDIALAKARQETPGVRYQSSEYEQTLRTLTLDFIRDEPGFVARSLIKKTIVVVKDGAGFLIATALLLPRFRLLGDRLRERRRMVLLVIPALANTLLPPRVATPFHPFELGYEVGLFGTLALLLVLALAWLASVDDLRTLLRSPAMRRAAVWSAAGLAGIAVAVALAAPIERQAADWQNSAPPPPGNDFFLTPRPHR
jgi:hypothetical protein